ncbi:DUF2752 domain-containing protein [Bacteroidota bacterium]
MKVKNSIRTFWQLIPLEAAIWIAALGLLIFNDPGNTLTSSICPFHNIGLDFCPGCGLGTSISYAFRGQFEASFGSHPLGIIAILILISRIFTLLKRSYKENCTKRINNHG